MSVTYPALSKLNVTPSPNVEHIEITGAEHDLVDAVNAHKGRGNSRVVAWV